MHGNGDHLHRRLGAVTGARRRRLDLLQHVHAGDDFGKHGVLGWTGAEPIEVIVVHGVQKELAAAGVGATGVGHRECAGFIRELVLGRMLVFNATLGAIAGAGAVAIGVATVRATKLRHKAVNHSVKVQAIIKAALGKLDEVASSLRHLVNVQFNFYVTK